MRRFSAGKSEAVPRLSGAEIEVIQRATKHQRKIGFLAGERAIQRSYDVNLV
jgi:hypothetical protein